MEAKGYWEHSWHRRLSRRSVLRGAAIGGSGLAAAAVIGCGGEEEAKPAAPTATAAPPAGGTPRPAATASPTPAAKQPKRGGTLNFVSHSQGVFQRGLDPHATTAPETGFFFFHQGLLRPNTHTFNPEPEIAQKWEQPSPSELVFSLAPGIKWHNKPPANGRLLTADDVAFSLSRVRTNDPRFVSRQLLASVDKIEAVDKATVKITMKQPDVTLLSGLAAITVLILAPEVVEKAGDKFASADIVVGTGAFILQSFDDTKALLVRNPDYWRPGLPYLDTIVQQFYADPQTLWSAFLAGRVDVHLEVPDAKKVSTEQAGKYRLEWVANQTIQGTYANLQKEPFNDPRLPKAMRLLVDHQEFVSAVAEQWLGRGYLGGALSATMAEWDVTGDELTKFLEWKQPKDEAVREALALLSAAGFTKDKPLRFAMNVGNLVGRISAGNELLHAQFNRLGQGAVQVQLRLLDYAIRQRNLSQGDFIYALDGMVAPQIFEPDSTLVTFYHPRGPRNYGKWNDAKLTGLIDKQRTIFDLSQRKAAIKEIIRYLIDNAPYSDLYGGYSLNATQNRVQNRDPEPQGYLFNHQYERVWLDT